MRIIFITGTDTGVGKTILTALLLQHLRQKPGRTQAMKPFCSGSRDDVELLQALQPGELTDAEMNPFYFDQPVAPLAAMSMKNRGFVPLKAVVNAIRKVAKNCDCLLVEGSGGLLVPLGKNFTVADVIRQLRCEVTVVAQNKLGTINHTLLTIKHLQGIGMGKKNLRIVLMESRLRDDSAKTNAEMIQRFQPQIPFISLPYLGKKFGSITAIRKSAMTVKKSLEKILKA